MSLRRDSGYYYIGLHLSTPAFRAESLSVFERVNQSCIGEGGVIFYHINPLETK